MHIRRLIIIPALFGLTLSTGCSDALHKLIDAAESETDCEDDECEDEDGDWDDEDEDEDEED